MKTLLFTVIAIVITCPVLFAQTYDLKAYPGGTTTVETFKAKYTSTQKKDMLNNAELCRNKDNKQAMGMKLQDPDTLENILISETDSTLMLFEYVKKLNLEIANLKQRLQTAGIP